MSNSKNPIEAIAPRIQELKAQADADIVAIEREIQAAREAASQADAEMATATESGDLAAYQLAKKKKADALDSIEMNERRLNARRASQLMSDSEYEETVTAVLAFIESRNEKAWSKIVPLFEEALGIGMEMSDLITSGNAALRSLWFYAHRVGKDPAEYKDYKVVWLARQCDSDSYREASGKNSFKLREAKAGRRSIFSKN